MMTKEFRKIQKDYRDFLADQKKIMAASNEMLLLAKKAIFALHRLDMKVAKQTLSTIADRVTQLSSEGCDTYHRYLAPAMEEYFEAKFLNEYIETGSINGALI